MANAILVPRLGWSMEEGTFAGWLKEDGARIKPGDALFVLESDKSAEEIEAIDAGILRIPPDGPKQGDVVKVGQVLAHLVAEGETVPQVVGAAAVLAPEAVRQHNEPVAVETRHKRAISPRARRAARELGIDWNNLTGSGRNGRIRERDVRSAAPLTLPSPPAGEGGGGRNGRIRERDVRSAAPLTLPSPPAGGEGRLIPHTNIRRTIAARMVAGVAEAAPVTLTSKLDATNLVVLREQFKTASDRVPSYSDFLVKLTAVVLRQHLLLQAQWRDDGLLVPERIDIALAVDTDAGLLVPVVRSADRMTLRQIAACSRELIEQARAGSLSAEQMREATFTITNLGGFSIDAFTPIIHLPQCAVLGVGRIVREPAVQGDRIVPREMLTLSLTFDHRVVDGAPAARFLQTLRGCLENPAPWLIE